MAKKIFKIPVTWEASGTVEIEANSIEEAIQIFDETQDNIGLPTHSQYVDASFRREDEECISLRNLNI